ncbi:MULTISPECIES: IS3 family transposase, partial [unclassified Bradyrhizobium]
MSAPDRRGLLQRDHESLSIRRQCQLLSVARSSVYRPPRPANDNDLELMRRIDQLFTAWPFLGSRRLTAMLNGEGCRINRKRVQRLMRKMGIAALGPKPRTTKPAPGHKIFPYLLRHLAIDRPNQVWAADITYVPIGQGFLYLVAIIDWASRAVLAWRLSNTMDTSFCVSALEEALARFGRPEISARCEASSRQYRPGQPVHQRRLHRHAGRHRRQDLDGRSRALDGQRVHRAAVALAQIRGHLSQGLF